MITGTNSPPRKPHKRRNIRDRNKPTSSNYRDKEGVNRGGGRSHDRSHYIQIDMMRMNNTQSKRGPKGGELPTSTRKITSMEPGGQRGQRHHS
jgi:hypothetical protein